MSSTPRSDDEHTTEEGDSRPDERSGDDELPDTTDERGMPVDNPSG